MKYSQINIVAGDDGLVKDMMEMFVQEVGTEEIRHIDKESHDEKAVNRLLLSPSMFSEKRLIIIRDKDLFNFEKIAKRIPENNIVVIRDKIRKDSKLYKYVAKNGTVFNFSELNKSEMKKWAAGYLSENDCTMQDQALKALVEYGPTSTMGMRQELDKLISYSGKSKKITIEHMTAVCQAEVGFNTWAFIDSLTERHFERSMNGFNLYYAEEGNSSVDKLLPLLIWHFRMLLLVLDLKDQELDVNETAKFVSSLKKNNLKKKDYKKFLTDPEEQRQKLIGKFPSLYKEWSVKKVIMGNKYFKTMEVVEVLSLLYNLSVRSRTIGKNDFKKCMTFFIMKVCNKVPMGMAS